MRLYAIKKPKKQIKRRKKKHTIMYMYMLQSYKLFHEIMRNDL